MVRDRRIGQSYEDIVRRTVPEVDSSFRPTAEQERQAREGFRAMDDGERALHADVHAALIADGHAGIDIEVDRDTVTLRGLVRDAHAVARIEDLVERVRGVGRVNNQLAVGAPRGP